jgi:hypothetical protein
MALTYWNNAPDRQNPRWFRLVRVGFQHDSAVAVPFPLVCLDRKPYKGGGVSEA